ncbi:hypothetical protein WR25_26572 [Diploscapter pachys]|uniref:Uncharacterized protein n=1 Tax=Diploscapter pachys TaxID=2018661 RepID=A0A2A2KCK1_9BILA|nr:hypothetical protein WR25_26572 [Diploscapter pachys]
MSAAAGYPLAVPPNVVGGVGQGPGPNPVAYGTMPGQPPNGASGAYGQAPGPMQQHHMQYSYAPNPAMDQYGMQTPYGHMNGTNYGSMIPTSMSTIKTEGPTSIYDPRNSYSYTPMDNGANGMGPPQQMAMRQQYSMQPQSMSSPMHPQMMPQMMQAQQQQRVNCQPNCSTASVSVASPMTHTSMHQQPTVQSPGGNRTPSYMTKAAKNQHPQQSPSHPSVNTPNMMGACCNIFK